MGVAVVANLVAEGGYGASDGGKPFHVHPADEKGGRRLIPVQDLEQLVVPSLGPSSKVRAIDRCRREPRYTEGARKVEDLPRTAYAIHAQAAQVKPPSASPRMGELYHAGSPRGRIFMSAGLFADFAAWPQDAGPILRTRELFLAGRSQKGSGRKYATLARIRLRRQWPIRSCSISIRRQARIPSQPSTM